jgi:hypothetical protein
MVCHSERSMRIISRSSDKPSEVKVGEESTAIPPGWGELFIPQGVKQLERPEARSF